MATAFDTRSLTSATLASRWARATAGEGEVLQELAGSYWYCVYAWWRRAGLDVSQAVSATIACWTNWCTTELPAPGDAGAARLREWLPARLSECAGREVELAGPPVVEIHGEWAERRYQGEPAGDPDSILQRRWALTVLEFAVTALRAEYEQRGEEALYQELLAFSGFGQSGEEAYAGLSERTGITVSGTRKAVYDFRTRQRDLLRALAADTLLDPADLESEMTALLVSCEAAGPDAAGAPLPTVLAAVQPDQVLARALNSVKMSTAGGLGWTPPTAGEVARLFPSYEVLSMLGHGGMGAVYQARQTSLDRLVAIKLLPLEISVDKDFADRFRREARAMAKLNHPNIIAVFDFGQTSEGHLFFVMEFVEGSMLHDLIHSGRGLPPADGLALLEQVCDALGYAHEQGIVHRDIKPANVMVDRRGRVKVADFGLARIVEAASPEAWGSTMTGVVMGTPDYMAPEQKRGMHVDHRADIYSLGAMLYETLCRETPQGAFALPSKHRGLDKRLDPIVTKALASRPEDRFQSTGEMKAAIELVRPAVAKAQAKKAAGPQGASVPPSILLPPDGISAAPAKKRGRLFALLGAALLAAIVAAIVVPGLRSRQSAVASAPLPRGPSAEPEVAENPPVAPAGNSVASASPLAGGWQNGLQNPAELELFNGAKVTPEGALFAKGGMLVLRKGPARDGAVRMRAAFDPASNLVLVMHMTETANYYAGVNASTAFLQYWSGLTKQTIVLGKFPIEPPLQPGQEYELQLETAGPKLTVKLQGKVLGEANDDRITEGKSGLRCDQFTHGLAKALEFLVPATNPAASVPVASKEPDRVLPVPKPALAPPSPVTPGEWQKVEVPEAETLAAKNATVNAAGEWHVKSSLPLPIAPARNVALRGEFRRPVSPRTVSVLLREGQPVSRLFSFFQEDAFLQLRRLTKDWTTLEHAKFPKVEGGDDWVPFQCAVLDEASLLGVGSATLRPGRSPEGLDSGGVSLGATSGTGEFRRLEYMLLDAVPEARWPDFALAALGKAGSAVARPAPPALEKVAPAPAATPLPIAAAAWQPLPMPPAYILPYTNSSISPAGVITARGGLQMPNLGAADFALRGECRFQEGAQTPAVQVRGANGFFRALAFYHTDAWLQISHPSPGPFSTLAHLQYPAELTTTGKWISFQLASIGETSIATIGSQPVIAGSAKEALAPGYLKILGEFRNLEFLLLDKLPEAQRPEFIRTGLKQVAATAP